MITEDYISFETAKLLKERGYWNIATTLYKENGDIVNYNVPLNNKGFSSTLGVFYEAPTLQMAMKWLREEHDIHIEVRITNHSFSSLIDIPRYYWIIFNAKEVKWMDESTAHTPMSYETYEEACEAAIKYYLENLI